MRSAHVLNGSDLFKHSEYTQVYHARKIIITLLTNGNSRCFKLGRAKWLVVELMINACGDLLFEEPEYEWKQYGFHNNCAMEKPQMSHFWETVKLKLDPGQRWARRDLPGVRCLTMCIPGLLYDYLVQVWSDLKIKVWRLTDVLYEVCSLLCTLHFSFSLLLFLDILNFLMIF